MKSNRSIRCLALCAGLAAAAAQAACSGDGDAGEVSPDGGELPDGDADPGDDGGSDAGVEPAAWQFVAGEGGYSSVNAACADPDQGLFVAGSFGGELDLGGGPLPFSGEENPWDAFVARFAADGSHVWSTQLVGGPEGDGGMAVAAAPGGDLFVAGYYTGDIAIGEDAHPGRGGDGVFIARLNGEDGTPLWSRSFGSPAIDQPRSIAVLDGDPVVTGTVRGSVDLGDGPADAGHAGFVVRLDGTDGRHVWSRLIGGTGVVDGGLLAATREGHLLLTGMFSGTASLGGEDLVALDQLDVYLAELDGETGAHRWSKGFPGMSTEDPRGLAVDDQGDIILAGSFQTTVSFGGPTLETQAVDARSDGYVVKLSPSGDHVWSRQVGDPDRYDSVEGADLLADGSIAVATVQEGIGSIPSDNTYAATLDPKTGETRSTRTFEGSGELGGMDITTVGAMVVVTGFFRGEVDFGAGPETADDQDAFITVGPF